MIAGVFMILQSFFFFFFFHVSSASLSDSFEVQNSREFLIDCKNYL